MRQCVCDVDDERHLESVLQQILKAEASIACCTFCRGAVRRRPDGLAMSNVFRLMMRATAVSWSSMLSNSANRMVVVLPFMYTLCGSGPGAADNCSRSHVATVLNIVNPSKLPNTPVTYPSVS
eukprot:7985150-Pyramimonas_sp.AAC.1